MSESAGEGASVGPPGEEPGALSRLLDELARAPHADPEAAWGKALRPGDVLDRFEILRELGRGGFGAVYEALDKELGRRVALKTLRPGRSRDEWADEQLRKEAQAAASLSHPGIVTLHEACTCDRGPYLVMELLRGETLESRLSRGPLPEAEAVEVGLQMARALAHVHGHGLVHRDLKPGNVFLGDDGRVKLLDLGLAHLLGRKSSTGGTPAYVAPEQWRGEEVDGRADVFALGAVLFEMVSGRRAFEVKEERSSALDAGPAPALPGKVPRGLARLVARCLAKEPSGRPTAAQAAEELLGIQRGQARPRALRRVGLLVGAGVVAGIVVALFALQAGRKGAGTSPDGRVVVAVADFTNETKDPDLDALSGLLVTSLEQSQRLRILTRGRMFEILDQLGHGDAPRIDERLARLVGREAAVNALLLATVRRFDDVYSLELQALDPARDDYLFAVKAEGRGKKSLPGLLDEVSEKARRRFQEAQSEVDASSVKIAENVTANLEAYRHFFAGEECLDRESFSLTSRCVPHFERAIERDPGFALAHAHLASLRSDWRLPGTEGSAEAALRNIERAPARDRAKIRFLAGQGWLASTIVEGREALRVAPDDRYLAFKLGQYMSWRGDQAGAIPIFRRLVEAHPSGESPAQRHFALALALTGQKEELRRLADKLASGPQTPPTLDALAYARGHLGDLPGYLAALRRLIELGVPAEDTLRLARLKLGEPAVEGEIRALAARIPDHLLTLAFLQTLQGRRREATRTLQDLPSMEALGLTDLRFDSADFVAADLLTGWGDAAAVWGRAARLKRPNSAREPSATVQTVEACFLAANLAYAGDLQHAAQLARCLDPGIIHERTFRAVAAWRAGDRAEARRLLEDLAASNPVGLRTASLPPAFLLGELAAEMGDDRKAVEALRTFRSFWYWRTYPHDAWTYPRSLYLAALSHERLGEVREARKLVGELLTLWKRADPDLPLLAEAKAMRKRLAAEKTVKDPATPAAKAEAPAPSIAVLPFTDMSPGKDQEYFADGVAEEILNALTHVRGLKVAGRTSSFSFKGRSVDLRTIGRKLGVAAVLEGSVRRDGDRVRITAQLVKAEDGFHLWSERYDRELTGVFAVQDEIARAVVAKVAPLVAGKPGGEIATAPTAIPEAYDWYLVGKQALRQNFPEAYRRAAEAYEKALAVDPAYAPAWAGLAFAAYWSDHPAPERAMDAAERAVALDPSSADALTARGHLRALHRFDWDGARSDFDRARALHPENPDVLRRHAQFLLRPLGRFREAIAAVRRATELDPLSPHAWTYLAALQLAAGDAEASRRAAERALELSPKNVYAQAYRGRALLVLGRPGDALASAQRANDLAVVAIARHELGQEEESRHALAELMARAGLDDRVAVARVHAWRGERERAFEWLDRALARRDQDLVWLKSDVLLRNLHADPRFAALLRKLNLPVD